MPKTGTERRPSIQVGGFGARAVALRLLLETERAGVMTDDGLERALTRANVDARDRALAVELFLGSLRHRGTLDWRLGLVSDRPIARLPIVVQMILRLGAYQIVNLSKIPPSAAVNESVHLANSYSRQLGRDWGGFVNAVLRTLTRSATPAWPEMGVDAAAALAIRYSCPLWLVQRWVQRAGREQAEAQCRTSLERPPLTLRVNTLHLSREDYLDRLAGAGCAAYPTDLSPSGVRLEPPQLVPQLPRFQEGDFYVEDEAAQLISLLVDPQPGENILDACAAPGGKTTHMAALMKNQGRIVAMERDPARSRLMMDNCARMGITIVTPLQCDARQATFSEGSGYRLPANQATDGIALDRPFDRILVDAPCSGLGVIRRHPEGKWYKRPEDLKNHQKTQRSLLDGTAHLLRPGGLLVYSACSTEPEENEQVIDHFCRTHQEFMREPAASVLPPGGESLLTAWQDFSTAGNAHGMDGFFAARLRKSRDG